MLRERKALREVFGESTATFVLSTMQGPFRWLFRMPGASGPNGTIAGPNGSPTPEKGTPTTTPAPGPNGGDRR
jgi:hypothetical protein